MLKDGTPYHPRGRQSLLRLVSTSKDTLISGLAERKVVMTKAFNAGQVEQIAQEVRTGEPPTCPECSVPLESRQVPPRTDVSYVRNRVWLVCSNCRRTAVIDRRS